MTSKSTFLPRLSLSRKDEHVLPFHNPSSPPLRRQLSEYDMSDLSPRPESVGLLSSDPSRPSYRSPSGRRSPSSSARYSDHASSAGSDSKTKTASRFLFTGPPPPIAVSTHLYRDEEDSITSRSPPRNRHHETTASFARNALTSVSSVLFDRAGASGASSSHTSRGVDRQNYEPDTFWRNLQQRQKALEKELQHILDAQSAGLAAYLDPTARTDSRSDASDAGSATPTNGGTSLSSTHSRQGRHVAFDDPQELQYGRVVIPVRQPRRKPMSLPAARKALVRSMTYLADLKAEEDAALTSALAARKKALAQLKRLASRRVGIADELRVHSSGGEPLGQELRDLERERNAVSREITELEGRLAGLKMQKRSLEHRIEDVANQREAGLSGYRNALKEVDADVSYLLKRPPVKPLDVEAIRPPKRDQDGNDTSGEVQQSTGGAEFFRLRPERRTIDMARDWWECEVRILEKRKGEVDKDRTALEEGVEVWNQAVKIVSDYEAELQKEMKGGGDDDDKGKNNERTPEEAFHVQLEKVAEVKAKLEKLLLKAEDRMWNLLICAIGAEVEAYNQGEALLREAMKAAGYLQEDEGADQQDDDDGPTPQLGRSMSGKASPVKRDGSPQGGNLVDFHNEHDEHDDTMTTESDNEVPPDLLVAHEEEQEESSAIRRRSFGSPQDEQEDSENEVPGEFLAEHDNRNDRVV
ncbi:hypothetical protein GE09DRAFT_542041 [Coniochaeta sp. 2T2.1]|nr:hypothetical protein GE09DRAFT_542041 [Coniochaeta sp. 2T2.1]